MAQVGNTRDVSHDPGALGPCPCPVCGNPGCVAAGALGGFALLSCTNCTHSFTPSAYHASVDYDQLYSTGDYLREQVKPLANRRKWRGFAWLPPYQMFLTVLGPARGRALLDIGCGVGRFGIVARNAGWRVAGIDPAVDAVHAGRSATGLELSTCTLSELSTGPERFDVVTLFDVLEHLPDPVAMLAQARQMLTAHGRLFATVPNFECPFMRDTQRPDWLPPVHLQFFSARSLFAAVTAAGLNVLGQGTIDSDPPPPEACAWLRWLSRRARRLRHYPAQLWVLAG